MPSIVVTNVSLTVAPAPITLQQTGALISQGGTSLAQGATALLTQPGDQTPLLAAPLALSSVVFTGGTVLATTAAAIPGLTAGDTFITTIANALPVGYNGTVLGTVTGANSFTYPLATNPGTQTAAAVYSRPGVQELNSMVGSYFAQGSNQAVYVLELGAGNGHTGPTALDSWLTIHPAVMYGFLIPRLWDATNEYIALLAKYQNLTSRTYFYTTTTAATYSVYPVQDKDVHALIEAPVTLNGVALRPLMEFTEAAAFQHALQYNPSSSNRMTPFAFSALFGVTPYPTVGNNAFLTTLKTNNINYVGTGAEGGISDAVLFWGKMLDGNDFSFWYSADWFTLNADEAITNVVLAGSQDPLNPLYYDQNGINRLQDAVVQVSQSAVAFGLANGTVGRAALDGPVFQQNLDNDVYEDENVTNAVPFNIYTEENPGAYEAETYGGLSSVYIPQRGFTQIVYNINVTSFLAQ